MKIVEPRNPLPGRLWVWRTMFWDVFTNADIALLERGFYLAFIDVGNTFGSPDAMKQFDAFYSDLTETYCFSKRPVLEGLSRGGLYSYRWASENPDKVGCIYGDAPVCDMKSWPGGQGKGTGSKADLEKAIHSYHFTDEQELFDYTGNPIDNLLPLAAAHVPIVHVYGDIDRIVPPSENSDIVRDRYVKLGGVFALIVKEGCAHHPHGLNDPTPVVNFIVAHCAEGNVAQAAARAAPAAGSMIRLLPGQW